MRRLLLGLLVVGILIILGAGSAAAHADFVAANPQLGIGIPQAPNAVVIEFSEPLNLRLSNIFVLDSAGHEVTSGPIEAVTGDPKSMQRKLGLLRAGTYTVNWTSVSRLDGHVLKGSYTFGIGVAPGANEQISTGPVASEGWLGLVGHAVELAGLVLWAGAGLLAGAAQRAGIQRRRRHALAVSGPLAVVVGTALAGLSSALVSSGSVGVVGEVFTSSASGRLRLALIGVAVVGVAVVWVPRPRVAFIALAVAALVLEAASGHAVDAAHPIPTVVSFTVHMLAVGVWIFALIGALLSSENLRSSLAVFSPYAIGGAALVAGTGIANAYTQLGSISEVISSGYGKVLVAKSFAFAAMVALGLTHSRWRRASQAARIQVPVRGELAMGAIAVVLAAVLVGSPNSPAGAGDEHAFSTGIDPVLGRLEGRPALSAAEATGPFVTALTMLPPSPGQVQFRAQVLGVQAGDAPRNARVIGSTHKGRRFVTRLRPCGMGCFVGSGSIPDRGRWDFELRIRTNRGEIRTGLQTPIPAPAASSLLARARRSMDSLRSARLLETLTSNTRSRGIRTAYLFHAPDQVAIRTAQTETLIIGRLTYRRESRQGRWRRQGGAFGFDWPKGYYKSFWGRPVAATVLGHATVRGVRTDVVSFLRPDLPAWFRLWIGSSDGLVYREQMRAEGHIMNHTYMSFDQISRLHPPARVTP